MRIKGRRKIRGRRAGASLVMVIIAVTVLIITGTLFTAIAMRSYTYSYAKLCKQQAYYTAEASIKGLYGLISSQKGEGDGTVITDIRGMIEAEYNRAKSAGEIDADAPITKVSAKIGQVGGSASDSDNPVIADDGTFKTLLGTCTLYARYLTKKKDQISLEAHATYRGYTEVAKARIGKTNEGAAELEKIFSNTFCMNTPIIAMVVGETEGDIFVTTPAASEAVATAEGTKYIEIKPDTNIPYTNGQYIRSADGSISLDQATSIGRYNTKLRDFYAQVQAGGTDTSSVTVHTKPLDMMNETLSYNGTPIYNDWVELYMFSQNSRVDGETDSYNCNIAIDGNLYSTSRMLIGLWDKRSESTQAYYRVWNEDRLRKETRQGIDEHGISGNSDVFFDGAGLSHDSTVFKINGDMWLWEDARIENFDSLHTPNAKAGIKNNIYAQKNLYIDGYRYAGVSDDAYANPLSQSNNYIYGDIIVQGDLFLADTKVYGNIYCYGDNMTIIDSEIVGNVYFEGSNLTADWVTVHGTQDIPVTIDTGETITSGGNVYVKGEGEYAGHNYHNYNADINSINDWGVMMTNCSVYGTIYSNVNTRLNTEKWWGGDFWSGGRSAEVDRYNNVIVDGFLFFDLRYPYEAERADDGKSECAAKNNNLDTPVDRDASDKNWMRNSCVKAANKMYIMQSQSTSSGLNAIEGYTSEIFLGNVYVGDKGFFMDGNAYKYLLPSNLKTLRFTSLTTASGGELYDATMNWRSYLSGVGWEGSNYSVGSDYGKSDSVSILIGRGISSLINSSFGAAPSTQADIYRIVSDSLLGKLDVEGAQKINDSSVWEDKVIRMRSWNAPAAALTPEEAAIGDKIYYTPVSSTVLSGENNVIDTSFDASGHVTVMDNSVVYFDTSQGNIYIKLHAGMTIGKNCKFILRGGGMVFFYLYTNTQYSIGAPTVRIGDGSQIGLVEELPGVEVRSDSLYFISNDDALVSLGKGCIFNGFMYMPKGHVYINDNGTPLKNDWTILDGCMAIEGMLYDSGQSTSNILRNYSQFVYNYIKPPLIIDSSLDYGDNFGGDSDFGQVSWEFAGFY